MNWIIVCLASHELKPNSAPMRTSLHTHTYVKLHSTTMYKIYIFIYTNNDVKWFDRGQTALL